MTGAVVITGASRGLGRALADHLSLAGHDLLLCARTREPIDELARELRSRDQTDIFTARVDVTDPDEVDEFAAAASTRFERVGGIVNNAGVLGPVGLLADANRRQWADAIAANLCSVAYVCGAFIPAMRGEGSIITLSGAGVGGPGLGVRMSAYATSKFAVVGLTEALARELSDTRIRVNSIAPGAVATEFMSPAIDMGPSVSGAELYEATVRNRANPAPMEPYFDLVRYLLDDRSSWLTGCLLSARWDSVERLEAARDEIASGSLLRLRRIDGELFSEVER